MVLTATAHSGGRRLLNRWRVIGWGCGIALLAVPALLGWPWQASGFAAIGMVFAVVGALIELAVRKAGNAAHGGAAAIALLTGFVLLWVGRIGSEDHAENLVYLAELAIAFAGAVGARFRAGGLSWAMGLTALFQLLVTLAIARGWGAHPGPSAFGSLGFNAAIVALWALAAVLFRTGAQADG